MARLDYWLIDLHRVRLTIPAGQAAAADRFYGEVLGMQRVDPSAAPEPGPAFRSLGAEVQLGEEEAFRPSSQAPAMVVSDLDRLRERLDRHRVPVRDDEEREGFQRLVVDDPFGNRLELLGER